MSKGQFCFGCTAHTLVSREVSIVKVESYIPRMTSMTSTATIVVSNVVISNMFHDLHIRSENCAPVELPVMTVANVLKCLGYQTQLQRNMALTYICATPVPKRGTYLMKTYMYLIQVFGPLDRYEGQPCDTRIKRY